MKQDKKEKCIFSKNGYCICWESEGDGKCDGIHNPKQCPDKKD